MKNDIEEFVSNNRLEFDDLTPNEKVWDAIENRIPNKGQSNLHWLWKAAAVVFFCTSVFLYVQPFRANNTPGDVRMAKLENKRLNNELEQVESFYIQMISEKRSLINTLQEEDSTEFTGGDYEEDLQKLDAMYEVLKKEFDNGPSKEVVDALVLNLLVRINILNKKLAELDTDEPIVKEAGSEINT